MIKKLKHFIVLLNFCLSFCSKIELLGLYDRFIGRKYEICLQEKGEISTTKVLTKEALKELIRNIVIDHQVLAFKVVFAEKQVAHFHINL